MSATPTEPVVEREQLLELFGMSWGQYVTICDALPEQPGLRMVYLDGTLTMRKTCRRHEWFADRLGELVLWTAVGCDLLLEVAGSATFRLEKQNCGVEGDKTYYFGDHAELMKGPVDIDLTTQPPPDLAIEVEVTHAADLAMSVYGRLGVPEVWRFDAERWKLSFWRRRDDGSYEEVPRSEVLPMVEPADVLGQLRLADEIGSARWSLRLNGWVQETLVPRLGNHP